MKEKLVHMVFKDGCCYNKLGKTLSKLPYEKQETVLIKVICCQGDRSIKIIQARKPEKPKIVKRGSKKEDVKVVVQPDRDNLRLLSFSSNPLNEGRPSYQYQNNGMSAAPSSLNGQPINDSYGGGVGVGVEERGYNVEQPDYNQESFVKLRSPNQTPIAHLSGKFYFLKLITAIAAAALVYKK